MSVENAQNDLAFFAEVEQCWEDCNAVVDGGGRISHYEGDDFMEELVAKNIGRLAYEKGNKKAAKKCLVFDDEWASDLADKTAEYQKAVAEWDPAPKKRVIRRAKGDKKQAVLSEWNKVFRVEGEEQGVANTPTDILEAELARGGDLKFDALEDPVGYLTPIMVDGMSADEIDDLKDWSDQTAREISEVLGTLSLREQEGILDDPDGEVLPLAEEFRLRLGVELIGGLDAQNIALGGEYDPSRTCDFDGCFEHGPNSAFNTAARQLEDGGKKSLLYYHPRTDLDRQ